MSMALRVGKKEAVIATITVTGRLDAADAAPLRAAIGEHLAKGTNRLIVDLSAVEFVDSAGLAALVIGMKRARLDGGDLRLVAPRHPRRQTGLRTDEVRRRLRHRRRRSDRSKGVVT